MFETATLNYGPSSKRVWTTAMGVTGQAMLIACAVLAPLISPHTLGPAILTTTLVVPPVPHGATPSSETRVQPRPTTATSASPSHPGIFAPNRVPTTVPARIVDTIDDAPGCVVGCVIGLPPGEQTNIPPILREVTQIPPPLHKSEQTSREQPANPPEQTRPPRVTAVRMATPIHRVEPVYPALAIAAHVSGSVDLLGVLGIDGRIHELRVLRGHPLLVKAALEAVSQWVYQPTLLNGQAVEVSAPITVNFILKR
jgi:protein TonB